MRPLYPGRTEQFRDVGFRGEENRRTRRKTLGAKREPTNKLNPHMTPGGNRTRPHSNIVIVSFIKSPASGSSTLVGGERSHHYIIPASLDP